MTLCLLPGPLGLSLEPSSQDMGGNNASVGATADHERLAVMLKAVKSSSPVVKQQGLMPGMKLQCIQVGQAPVYMTADRTYKEVLDMIKNAARPLTLTFMAPPLSTVAHTNAGVKPPQSFQNSSLPGTAFARVAASSPRLASSETATFNQPGPLGISWARFQHANNPDATHPLVKAVKPGSAAAKAGVQPRKLLATIDGVSITRQKWDDIIETLKTKRPITLGFSGSIEMRNSPITSATTGTVGSLSAASPLNKTFAGSSGVSLPSIGKVSVTFVAPGALGLSLVAANDNGLSVVLTAVKPESPIFSKSRRLKPGMRVSVGTPFIVA